MVKRASTVWASTARAEKRKALSGESGRTCATAGRARRISAAADKSRVAWSVRPERRFGGDPLEVGWQSMAEGDNDNLRKFVRVARDNRRLQRLIEYLAGLDHQRRFVDRFDFPAPVVQ